MTRSKTIEWLEREIAAQRQWIREHGGDRLGYIARYGDPLVDVTWGPNAGKPMYGEGGTSIFNADMGELIRLETLLAKAQGRAPRTPAAVRGC
jgi:hypothetical protein